MLSVPKTRRRNVQGHRRQDSNQLLKILSYKEETQSFCFHFLVSKRAPASPLSTSQLRPKVNYLPCAKPGGLALSIRPRGGGSLIPYSANALEKLVSQDLLRDSLTRSQPLQSGDHKVRLCWNQLPSYTRRRTCTYTYTHSHTHTR